MSTESVLENSVLCKRLRIEYPIIEAGMGQVAYGRLAAAVSAAGGLGVIGAGYLTADELRREGTVLALGLMVRVVPAAELDAAGPAEGMGLAKILMARSFESSFDEILERRRADFPGAARRQD